MKIFAKKGEKVTCEKGHEICTVAKTIKIGAIPDGKEFINWKQPEPKMGGAIPVCAKCGAEFYTNDIRNGGGIHIHFNGGWR